MVHSKGKVWQLLTILIILVLIQKVDLFKFLGNKSALTKETFKLIYGIFIFQNIINPSMKINSFSKSTILSLLVVLQGFDFTHSLLKFMVQVCVLQIFMYELYICVLYD